MMRNATGTLMVLCIAALTGCTAGNSGFSPSSAQPASGGASSTGNARSQNFAIAKATAYLPIQAQNSGKCLAVQYGSSSDGTAIVQWDCNTGSNEVFSLNPISAGIYQVIAQNSGKCLAVQYGSSNDGAAIVQWDCNVGANELFSLTSMGANNFQLIAQNSGKCLTVQNGSSADGAAIIQWDCNTGPNDIFNIPLPGSSAPAATPTPNPTATPTPTPTPTPTATPTPTPTSTPLPVSGIGSGAYQFAAQNSGLCLNVSGGSTANGAAIVQYGCVGSSNELFTVKSLGSNIYQIISQSSGKCFAVFNGLSSAGAQIIQWDCNSGANETFSVQALGSKYEFIAQNSGMCLAVSGSSTTAGAQIVQSPCIGSSNELFSLQGASVAPPPTPQPTPNPTATPSNPSQGGGGNWAGSPDPNAIVISTSGNDANSCTVQAPCQSLERAQSVARNSADKTIYLRAGTYNRVTTMNLNGADNGESWMTYPGDAVDSAILVGNSSLFNMFNTDGNNLTFNGLKMMTVGRAFLSHDDGSSSIQNLTVLNCDIGFNYMNSNYSPLISINGVNGATLKNNYIHDSQGMGIDLNAYQSGLVMDNVLVQGNVVMRTSLTISDTGGIYLMHHNNYVASNVVVSNNYVKDFGAPGVIDAHGIYLDQGTNHVNITGNVVATPNSPANSSTGMFLADGYSNSFNNNIFDLGNSGSAWTGVWWYTGDQSFTINNNTFYSNVIVSNFSGYQITNDFNAYGDSFYQGAGPAAQYGTGASYSIYNNLYHNYAGGAEVSAGNLASDTNAVHQNPSISGWNYSMATNSPAYSAIGFKGISGNFGPPAFVIPQTGNAPSVPH